MESKPVIVVSLRHENKGRATISFSYDGANYSTSYLLGSTPPAEASKIMRDLFVLAGIKRDDFHIKYDLTS